MKPEVSLPYQQNPATSGYPEPDQSSPRPPIQRFNIYFNTALQMMSVSPSWYLSVFKPNPYFLPHAPRGRTFHSSQFDHSPSWHAYPFIVLFINQWSAGQKLFATSFFVQSPVLLLHTFRHSWQSYYFAAGGCGRLYSPTAHYLAAVLRHLTRNL